VRLEGANHQWRKIPPGEVSIDPEADERLGRVTGCAGASYLTVGGFPDLVEIRERGTPLQTLSVDLLETVELFLLDGPCPPTGVALR
jgi:hypothetical protein